MFVAERQHKIIELVKQFGKVRVKDLSEQFHVTEDCIRKDLAVLERQDVLKRVYGGAVLARSNLHQFEVEKRKLNNLAGKLNIAKKAVGLLRIGDVIFLDVSTTNLEVAKLLVDFTDSLTIVTNMVEVLHLLGKIKQHKVIFIGGELNQAGDAVCGALAIQVLSQFSFDLAFMGTTGVDVYEDEVSTYSVDDGLTKAAVIKASRKVYLLAESVKFDCAGNYKYASISDFDAILVDVRLPMIEEQLNREYSVPVK